MGLETLFSGIADAIREKDGSQEDIVASTFPERIRAIPSGSGDLLDFIARDLSPEYVNPNVTVVGPYGMAGLGCTKIVLENVEEIGNYGLAYNSTAEEIECPNVLTIGVASFDSCSKVKKMEFLLAQTAGNAAFRSTLSLEALIIRTPSVMTLATANVFISGKIAAGTGYIYVPANMVSAYKEAVYWKNLADQIRAIEDYPDICG